MGDKKKLRSHILPNLTQPWILSAPTCLHKLANPLVPRFFPAPSHAALHNSPAIWDKTFACRQLGRSNPQAQQNPVKSRRSRKRETPLGRPFVGNPTAYLRRSWMIQVFHTKKVLPIENLQNLPRPRKLRSAVPCRASLGNFMAGCWTATCSSGRIYCGHKYMYMNIYVYMYYVNIYIYICVCMYTYIYIYTNQFGRANLETHPPR